MKNRKAILIIAGTCLSLALVLLSPACGNKGASSPTTMQAAKAAEYKMPDPIRINAGGTGGTSYFVGAGVAPAIERVFGVKVRVLPVESATERVAVTLSGGAEMISFETSNMALSMASQGSWNDQPPAQFRNIWFLGAQPVTVMVRGDSNIKSVYDIKGKRVAQGIHSAICMLYPSALAGFAGLSEKDITIVPISGFDAMHRSVTEGKADVSLGDPTAAVSQEIAASPQGIRWLPLPHNDAQAWARYWKVCPTYKQYVIKSGEKGAIGIEGSGDMKVMVCPAALPDDFAYRMAKCLDTEYNTYKAAHALLAEATRELQKGMMDSFPGPWHPGAIKYLKEIGVWTDKAEKRQKQWLETEAAYKAAYESAVKTAKEKGVPVDYKNADWKNIINSLTANIKVPYSAAPLN